MGQLVAVPDPELALSLRIEGPPTLEGLSDGRLPLSKSRIDFTMRAPLAGIAVLLEFWGQGVCVCKAKLTA